MTPKEPIMANESVKLVPLGGMGEIGKNMILWECDDDAILVDAGLAFPEEEMLGIDIVIPDLEYLISVRDKISGIFLTHGHEDHIGALPYVLEEMTVPVYGPGLAMGLAQQKLEEVGLAMPMGSRRVKPKDKIETDKFDVEFFRVNHSIADAMGLAVRTPAGLMVHSGDFKFDHTPIDGQVTDFYTLARLGNEGVRCLICDSTNAEKPGYTGSERLVSERMREIFREAHGRILFTTFASNIPRIQEVIKISHDYGRKVCVVGRSMENSVRVSEEMDYIDIPEDILIDVREIKRYDPSEITLLVTGSQGEPMSALTRMATERDRRLSIWAGDTVIIAARPVPGNEKLVYRTVDNLSRLGAKVIYGEDYGVHVSGHASREELKFLINLLSPECAIPVHGEYRHMVAFHDLAYSLDIEDDNIFLLDNGEILEFTQNSSHINEQIPASGVLVDGLGVGDVGNVVLNDREQLSEHGIIIVVVTIDKSAGKIVSGPEVLSRGFVYVRESEDLLQEAKGRAESLLKSTISRGITDRSQLKKRVRDSLGSYVYERLERRPMILPIIMEL